MGKTDIVVPQVIRDAVHNALGSYPVAANTGHAAEIACEAFARTLREHPVIPTHEQAIALCEVFEDKGGSRKPDYPDSIRAVAVEFQRHMFDAPEPNYNEEIGDLMWQPTTCKAAPPFPLDPETGKPERPDLSECHNSSVREAYLRGLAHREQSR